MLPALGRGDGSACHVRCGFWVAVAAPGWVCSWGSSSVLWMWPDSERPPAASSDPLSMASPSWSAPPLPPRAGHPFLRLASHPSDRPDAFLSQTLGPVPMNSVLSLSLGQRRSLPGGHPGWAGQRPLQAWSSPTQLPTIASPAPPAPGWKWTPTAERTLPGPVSPISLLVSGFMAGM